MQKWQCFIPLGGSTGQTYDNSTVEIQLPFLDASKPATSKDFTGIDMSCTNQWTVSVATDPTDITINQEIATIDRTTYGLGRATFTGYSTHLAPKLVCTSSGAAKIGNLALHYDMSEAG